MIRTTITTTVVFDSSDEFDEARTLVEFEDRLREYATPVSITVERQQIEGDPE